MLPQGEASGGLRCSGGLDSPLRYVSDWMYDNDQGPDGALSPSGEQDDWGRDAAREAALSRYRYDVAQDARRVRLRQLLGGPAPVSWALIVVIVLVYVWFLVLEWRLQGAVKHSPFLSLYTAANWAQLIADEGQYYRLVTSIFLHASPPHLIVNGYAIYAAGFALERMVGGARYWLIILGAGLAGNLASMVFSGVPSVGISGSIFGVIGALFVVSRKYRDDLPDEFAARLRRTTVQVTLINLGIGVVIPRIDNTAHIGGLIGGVVVALVLGSLFTETKERAFWVRVVALLSLVATIYAATPLRREIHRCLGSTTAMERCYSAYLSTNGE